MLGLPVRRVRRGFATTLVASTALVWFVGVAQADLRYGVVADPRDTPDALSGLRQPDIESIHVQYDSVGSLVVSARFFEPLRSDASPDYDIKIKVGSSANSTACEAGNPGDVEISSSLHPAGGFNRLTMIGLDGSLAPSRSLSADGMELTLTTTATQLAGRSYMCALGGVFEWDRDGHCVDGCAFIGYWYTRDQVSEFFFAGFAPPIPACADGLDNDGDGQIDLDDSYCLRSSDGREGPLPTCSNGIDDDHDGKVDLVDPGCRGRAVRGSEKDPPPARSHIKLLATGGHCRIQVRVPSVAPASTPVGEFPYKRVRISVAGRGGVRGQRRTRTVSVGSKTPTTIDVSRAGRYVITATYPGDKWRRSSRVRSKPVRAVGCDREF